MADEEQLEILKFGVEVWNIWRIMSPDVRPDLNYAELRAKKLNDGDFRYMDMRYADLTGCQLDSADFSWSNLTGAILRYAHLSNASLYKADISGADLTGAELINTELSESRMAWTTLGDNDLSVAKGLENIFHGGPSVISINTIYKSKGNIPEVFLRGAGVPDNLIMYVGSLTGKAFEFYSCFISYSNKDQSFVERLYADLQNIGVRCWYAPEDLKIGEEIRFGIDKSIHLHDKVLLVLSETSVKSQWVQQEVETALARERSQSRTVLFPIRIDDAVMKEDMGWPALIRNTRHIGDFREWKDHDAYRKAFDRLIRDLKAEGSAESTT